MKVWLLYDNPHDEGDNVYGAFSTEEKAEKAFTVFQSKANHPLFIREFELDSLEEFYERASSEYTFYVGWYMGGKWDFSLVSLDSFLSDRTICHHILKTGGISATIYAKSTSDAEHIANDLLSELEQQPVDERGWKWLEKSIS